jgi:hypothetical protein
MSIKRYTASLDTTITNAFKGNLSTRGTGSNMGASDILEIFSIYGQADSGSAELSRVLIQFPIEEVSSSRASGLIPVSGNVSFYMRLFNARHADQLPRDFALTALPISASWEEGYGLDMESYSDLTYDQSGSNWENASGQDVQHMGQIDFKTNTKTEYQNNYVVLYNGDGKRYNFWFKTTGGDTAPTIDGEEVEVNIVASADNKNTYAAQFNSTVNSADYGFTTTYEVDTDIVHVTASIGGQVTPWTGSAAQPILIGIHRSGSDKTQWSLPGGDYHSVDSSGSHVKFVDGTENLELDISHAVEEWLHNQKPNYGMGVMLTGSMEAYYSSSQAAATGNILHNPTGSKRSFYTKKFFSRGSEYFFKRPVLEARWNSAKKDNSANFYLSSSLADSVDNLNTIYLYNYVKGQLKDLPAYANPGNNKIFVSIISGTADNTAPATGSDKICLPVGGGVVTDVDFNITGSRVEKGIYSASFAYTSSEITTIFPVWHTGSGGTILTFDTLYHTGSGINVNTLDSFDYNPNNTYVSKITNLKPVYSNEETARFRVYTREKNWNPTIYTSATTEIQRYIVESASFKVFRVVDDLEVIGYGTGSDLHTQLSYDNSGSYFDLDMSLFEPDYAYGIKFVYYDNNSWKEQKEMFKFRVETNR